MLERQRAQSLLVFSSGSWGTLFDARSLAARAKVVRLWDPFRLNPWKDVVFLPVLFASWLRLWSWPVGA